MNHPLLLLCGILVLLVFLERIALRINWPLGLLALLAGLVYRIAISTHIPGAVWVGFPPGILIEIILPVLLFTNARHLKITEILKIAPETLLLTVPSAMVGMVIFAFGLQVYPGLPSAHAWLMAAALTTTDPLAVVSLLHRFPLPERLRTLVESESILNDGTSMLVFALAASALRGEPSPNSLHVVLDFLRMSVGGLLAGLCIGAFGGWILRRISTAQSGIFSLFLPLPLVWITFQLAEHVWHVSAILAVFSASIALNICGTCRVNSDTPTFEDRFWDIVATVLPPLLFFSLGARIGAHLWSLGWKDALWMALLLVTARAAVVYSTAAVLRPTPRHFPKGWPTLLQSAGIKGGLSVALLLTVPESDTFRSYILCGGFAMVLFTFITHTPWARQTISTLSE